MALAAKILTEHAAGKTMSQLSREYKVGNTYLQNVLHNHTKVCAYCKEPFYPTKAEARWGSAECYNAHIAGLGGGE